VADLAESAESTNLVDGSKPWFAGEVHKALHFASKIIRDEGDMLTAISQSPPLRDRDCYCTDTVTASQGRCLLLSCSALLITIPTTVPQSTDSPARGD
jgi:hypothetical protein